MLAMLIGMVPGCDDEPVRSYTVANAPPAAPAAGAESAGPTAPSAPPAQELPQWQVPAGWAEAQELPLMIDAMFTAPAGDDPQGVKITVSALPGNAGGDLGNVNRWRGQVGLGPVESLAETGTRLVESLAGSLTGSQAGAQSNTAKRVDLTSPADAAEPARLTVVWLMHDGTSWFFKMLGPPAAVAEQAAAFDAFIASIKMPRGE